MKKTKWTTHTFTKEEKKAQRQWQTADRQLKELFVALDVAPNFDPDGSDGDDREQLYDRLDQRLDDIAVLANSARNTFSEVEESVTIATGTINP